MIIEIEHATYRREGLTLLKDVSWQVAPGEHWALLGLNGSGKTTLLNLINGYFWPSEGKVSVLGHRFGEIDLRELRKEIGWVSTSLQEKLYASDRVQNIVLSGKYATIGLYDRVEEEDVELARSLIAKLGCSHLWDREYRTCSQGEKQKLLIARALMAKPRILILDEPCNGLDLFSRERLLESIKELTESPDAPTIIFVTHHTEEILPVFTHTLLIRQGEIVRSGRNEDVLTSDVLSGFYDSPVVVETHGDRVYVRIGD
ncbi:ABC transporter ATP-binding protein [Paenibacillus sp. CCS19]|uniref:ABC transporter ATP-binding protein n=1 Tax=Paenibacillus sp. CCS19 TaxID=3158387 RepID=UPI00256B82D2|nr:ABC transporter ATP-binding protein [Paenibacillus cellulosilyticus]GMK38536.1 ABC transporter ATP-binding protein [Paenibacillus cellulosilyticus]